MDSVYRTRSLGVAAAGVPDQYADGKAAKVWELYTGAKQERTKTYKNWIIEALRKRNCKTVLDVACGTGVDSLMLLEEDFQVVSTDASDKMLKYALKERWTRRADKRFDSWVIEEANWLTLEDDLEDMDENLPKDGFDAVICLGNSFAHLPDFRGDQMEHLEALKNFYKVLKPGGVLIIDHRNYDSILDTGKVPPGKNIYYPSNHIQSIKTSNLYVDGNPFMITLDYTMDITAIMSAKQLKNLPKLSEEEQAELKTQKFRLSYYPHRVENFTNIVIKAFNNNCTHKVYADFKELSDDYVPRYYIHIIQKNP